MSLSPLIYWALAFLVVSLAGLFLSNKFIKIDLDKNGELIVAMLTILGTLVSVLLGLLVSSADAQYSALESTINGEAIAVNEVFRLSRGLPEPTANDIQDLCFDYCDKVISYDWPAMKDGNLSPKVSAVYEKLSDTIIKFHPTNDSETNTQAGLISATSQLGQARGSRIVASRSTWTRRLLPLILTCAIVVLACSYLYAGTGSLLLHSVLVGLVAITLGTNIGVIFLMTRPFASEWAIQPLGFKLSAEALKKYKGSVRTTAPPSKVQQAISDPHK